MRVEFIVGVGAAMALVWAGCDNETGDGTAPSDDGASSSSGSTSSGSSTSSSGAVADRGDTPAPKPRPKFVRFVENAGFVDELGALYGMKGTNGWLDYDPGPVTLDSIFILPRGLRCLVRGATRRLVCYGVDINYGATGSSSAPTAATRAVIKMANAGFVNTTSMAFDLLPGAERDAHTFCFTHGSPGGLQCLYSGVDAKPIWQEEIGAADTKRVLLSQTGTGRVLTKSDRLTSCVRREYGSTAVDCTTDGPALMPSIGFVDIAGTETRGVGLTTTGTLVQWGFPPEADAPPSGVFRNLATRNVWKVFCAVATTGELACWSLDATKAATALAPIVGQKVADASLGGTSESPQVRVIGLDGAVKEWPSGKTIDVATNPQALDSCTLIADAGKGTPVCSEITDYGRDATRAEYYDLCIKENGKPAAGDCRSQNPDLDISTTCLSQRFKIGTKEVSGTAYFYRFGYTLAQAQAACIATTGHGTHPRIYE